MKSVVAILATTLLMLSPVPFIQAQSPKLQELQKQLQHLRQENKILKIGQELQKDLQDLKQEDQILKIRQEFQKQLQQLRQENEILTVRQELQKELQDVKQENQLLQAGTTLGGKTALARSGALPQNDNHGGIAKLTSTERPKEVKAAEQAAVTQSNAAAAAAQYNAEVAQYNAATAAVAQFNAAAVQQQQEQGAAAQVAAQAARAQKTRIQGFVSRKTNDGLIVELSVRGGVSHNATDVPMGISNPIGGPGWNGFNRVFLRGYPDQENLADDNLVDAVAYESGTASLGSSTYRCYTFVSR